MRGGHNLEMPSWNQCVRLRVFGACLIVYQKYDVGLHSRNQVACAKTFIYKYGVTLAGV